MKKKFHLFFSITMLALCVGAIAIGVYSAKRVSLNISGNVGFSVHDCDVNITGYMYGHTDTIDGKPILEEDKVALTPINISGENAELSLGDFYFSDLGASGKPESIVIELTITNQSKFEVLVDDITNFANDNVEVVCLNNLVVLYTDEDKAATVKYFLDVKPNAEGKYSAIPDPIEIPLALDFSKVPQVSKEGFVLDGNTITEVPTIEQWGSDTIIIPSKFSDSDVQVNSIRGYDGDPVVNIDYYKKIVLLKGITTIGEYAISICPDTTHVAIPNTVNTIARCAFNGSGIASVFIPTSVTNMGDLAFSYCHLKRLKYETSVEGNYTFKDGLLTVTSSADGFICPGIDGLTTKADLSLYTGTSLGKWAFSGCYGLTEIILPSNVTSIGNNAFSGCEFKTVKYEKIGSDYTFKDGLLTIKTNTLNSSSGWCTDNISPLITSATIPSSVSTIGRYAFSGCSSLTSVTFEGATASTTWKAGSTNVSVTNPATNATNLKSTYDDYAWTKNS